MTATSAAAPLTETLTGNGYNFAMALAPPSATVVAGLSATPIIDAAPLGSFSAPITLTCSTTAPGVACAIANPTVTLASEAQFDLTVSTTSRYTLVGYGVTGSRALLGLAGLAGLCLPLVRRHGDRPASGACPRGFACRRRWSDGLQRQAADKNSVFTPAGTYTVQLSAADGILVRNATYILTVKAKELRRWTRRPQRRLRDGMCPLDRRHP